MGRSFTERLNAGKKKKSRASLEGVHRRTSDGSHGPGSVLSDISSEAGSLSQFSSKRAQRASPDLRSNFTTFTVLHLSSANTATAAAK